MNEEQRPGEWHTGLRGLGNQSEPPGRAWGGEQQDTLLRRAWGQSQTLTITGGCRDSRGCWAGLADDI